ncbi:MAG: phosphate/phosphite/phosphonate ABC transporter substrate-binding protein [Phototrophicaceae bacterium]|jgi:hypothetical protein
MAKPDALDIVSLHTPVLTAVLFPVMEVLAAAVGLPVRLKQARPSDPIPKRTDLLLADSLYYELHGHGFETLAAPVWLGKRYKGHPLPVTFSSVVVHTDSEIKTFSNLRGHSWGYDHADVQTSYGLTRYTLVRHEDNDDYFRHVYELHTQEAALRQVAKKAVDSTTVEAAVLELFQRAEPRLAANLRVIEILGPTRSNPILVRHGLALPLRANLSKHLVGLHRQAQAAPLMQAAEISHYVPITHDDYHDVRAMLKVCHDYESLTIRGASTGVPLPPADD